MILRILFSILIFLLTSTIANSISQGQVSLTDVEEGLSKPLFRYYVLVAEVVEIDGDTNQDPPNGKLLIIEKLSGYAKVDKNLNAFWLPIIKPEDYGGDHSYYIYIKNLL